MIDCIEFTNKYYPSASSVRKNDIERFLNNLSELIGNTPIEKALQDKQLLCRSFYLQKACDVSRPHYQKIKEYLVNLFHYLGVDGTVPTRAEVMKSQNLVGYFRSINSLLKFIDEVGKLRLLNYDPTRDLVRVKAICVLGWIGFSLEDIFNLKKTDLIPIDNVGFKIRKGKEEYDIFGEPFAVLFYLQSLESYHALPSGKKTILKGNEDYLFRPTDSRVEKFNNAQQGVQIIKRFNACIPKTSSSYIVFRNLHKNALFLEVYEAKPMEKDLLGTLMSIMNCTFNYALSYKEQYLKFVEALESNRI